MSRINIYLITVYFQSAEANPFASKPIAVLQLVNVPVYSPWMKENILHCVTRQYADPRSNHPTTDIKNIADINREFYLPVKIMRIWKYSRHFFFYQVIITISPYFLQTNNIITVHNKNFCNSLHSVFYILR